MSKFKTNIPILTILVFFAFSILVCLPILLDRTLIHGNDLMVGISNYTYIKESLLGYHSFPQWNSFTVLGLPIVNDPLNNFLNPFVLVLFLIFPFIAAVKIFFVSCVFFSGLFFYLLCRYFGITKILSILTSFVYMSSGFLAARIIAGHFEWILTYPLIPLFYYFLFRLLEKKNIFWTGLASLTMTLLIFSGNLYAAFYSALVIASVITYLLIEMLLNKKKKVIITHQIKYLILFFLLIPFFSAAKILPMVELQQDLVRNINAFQGSQNVLSVIYNFFIPSQRLFTYFNIESYIASPYLWWESFAYIGPVFLIGVLIFFYYKKNIKIKYLNLLMFISLILILYSFSGNPLSPFHWLNLIFPAMQTFRVPSRIFISLIPLVLIVSISGINYLYVKTNSVFVKLFIILLLTLNLVSTVFIFQNYYHTKIFPPINRNFYALLDFLKKSDSSHYYIAQSIFFQNQLPLYYSVGNHQKIFDPMGGWGLKGNPTGDYANADFTGTASYKDVYPKYFMYPNDYFPPKTFNSSLVKTIGNANLYKSPIYTPYAYLTKNINPIVLRQNDDTNIKSITIGINKIDVSAYSPDQSLKLVLLESSFFGWKVSIDGKEKTLNNYRFLSVNTEKGYHEYSFTFFSKTFAVGLGISLTFFIFWVLATCAYFYRNRKKEVISKTLNDGQKHHG